MYKFENLREWLNKNNFPEVDKEVEINLIVREITKQVVEEGHIIFKEDGIFWRENGKETRGFVYISLFYIYYKNKGPNFPKFHTANCKTIKDFLKDGTFKDRYHFSNKGIVSITDKISGRRYDGRTLNLCSNCLSLTHKYYRDSVDFVKQECSSLNYNI